MQSEMVAATLARLENSIRQHPEIAEFHNDLGLILSALGDWDNGIAALQRAIELRPDYPEALDNLGVALQSLGRFEEALAYHERSRSCSPVRARTQLHLAIALLHLRRLEESAVAFERAIALDVNNAEAYNGRGVVYQNAGQLDRAIEFYRLAIEKRPQFAEAACNLGIALRESGERAEAIGWFERAVELDPRNGRFYRYLVESRKQRPEDKHLAAMEALVTEIDQISSGQRTELRFALAKAYNDVGRYDEAFVQLRDANALRRAEMPYDEERMLASMESQHASLTPALLESLRGNGNPSDRPVFIFGMPRSGTTLVEQLLCAHSDVFGAGELNEFEKAITASNLASSGGSVEQLRVALRALGDRYLEATAVFHPTAPRITDKMSLNFRFAGLIHLALPNARMIHIRRNALDTCISCYSTYFVDGMPFSNDLEELGRYYAMYDRMMAHWQSVLPAESLLQVQYEDLVEDFETQARRIVEFCGLEWQRASLEFHKVKRPVRTASHSQVREPLYRTSVGRASNYEEHLRPLVDAIGL